MQPRLYDPSRPFERPMAIIVTPPDQHVLLLGTRADAVKLCLHWVNGLSIPCVEGECPYCHLDVRPYAYAPAAWCTSDDKGAPTVCRGILPVPFTAFDLIDEYNTSIWYTIGRKGGNKSGRMIWNRWQAKRDSVMKPFPVLAHLKKLWEKRIAKLAPIDDWKQFVSKDDAEEAA